MVTQMMTSESHADPKTEVKPQCEAKDADEEVRTDLMEDEDEDEMEAQSETEQLDELESDSESPVAKEPCANFKACWKLVFVWKVLSLGGLLVSLQKVSVSSVPEEPGEIMAKFEWDVECCANQAAGFTAMCSKAKACLPCDAPINVILSDKPVSDFSSFALGMDLKIENMDLKLKRISNMGLKLCKLVAGRTCDFELFGNACSHPVPQNVLQDKGFVSLSCDSELYSNSASQNITEDKPVSVGPDPPANPLSHNISQELEEESARLSLPQWCRSWPSIGVSSLFLAISVKLMVF